MDFNDDEPSAPIAKPATKFQPKAKIKARAPPPKKVTATAKPSVTPQPADNQPVASPTKAKVLEHDISDSTDASNAGVKAKIFVQETTNSQTLSGADPLFSSMENLSTISYGYMEEHDNIEESANQPFLSGESMIENTEGFAGLDSVDDIIPQSTNVSDPTFDASNCHNGEDTTNGSLLLPFPFLSMETIQLETQGEQDFTSYDFMSDVDLSSGRGASKFLPKVKQKHGKTTMGNGSAFKEALVDPSETQIPIEGFASEGSLHVRDDDVFSTNPHNEGSLNQVGLLEASSDFMSNPPSCTDATTDCPLSQTEYLPHSDSGVICDNSSQQINSFSEDMHSQPLPLVPESENNNVHNVEKAGPKKRKPSSRSKKDKDANGNDKSIRKRKKATEASEKSTDASKKSSEQPPKKFSHTTRRRNRSANKSLLETPEDEIDYLSLPIKDLIMLAEHRERQNKEVETKQTVMPVEETTAPVVEPVERTNFDLWEDPPDDYDEEYSAQAEGSFDNPLTSGVAQDCAYFNYHSHMTKTPRVKWSKQDTQLFYEGLRQFGSDLSMIQHLFPGRTRQQIKLKYKREERQQPMQLLDALANRSKDLSHYKLVIGRLQEQIDQEEEQRRAEEEALGATGNEGIPEEGANDDIQEPAQDEGAKSEQNDDGLDAVKDPDEAKIGSPTGSKDSDLDMYDWSQYKSDF